jgi:transcriptional regulator GlxA family with amidase domain
MLILNEVIKEQNMLLNKGKVVDFSENSSCIADKINRFLYDNLDKNVSICELADTFNFSPTHIRRLYKDFMGMSIGEYLKETRMARAKKFLMQTDMKISEIAPKCGYESVYSFSNAFKNIFGISPKKFRNDTRK